MRPLKFFTVGRDVYLAGITPIQTKLICRATSNRLAQKIAANMNLMESRQQKAHEVYAK